MSARTPSTRRDRRYALRPGAATCAYTDPSAPADRREAPLAMISASGLELRVDDVATAPAEGAQLDAVALRIGDCVLEGEAVVRFSRPRADGSVEVGCLFYPGNSGFEERLVVFLAGLDAAQPD